MSSTNSSTSSNGKNRLSMRVSLTHHHGQAKLTENFETASICNSSEDSLRLTPEKFSTEISRVAAESLNKLSLIWKEAGYEEIECHRLLGDIFTKVNNLLIHEINAEEQILNHAKQEIEATIQDIIGMNAQLGRNADFSYLKAMHCSDQLTELEKILQQVTTDFNQRQSLLDQEIAKISHICDELGEDRPDISIFRGPENTPLLSDLRLNLMKSYHQDMIQVRSVRFQDMIKIAKDCVSVMMDMKFIEDGFNTMLIGEDKVNISLDQQIITLSSAKEITESVFTLHKNDMSKLSKRLQELLEEKEKRRVELAITGEEIAKLWSLLRIPASEREAFTHSFERNLSLQTLNVGYEEVNRLRELKKQSFGVIINTLRQDIMLLWEEVGVNTHEQREREFPIYFTDVVQLEEDAIDQHENYCRSLKAKVEELKPILSKVNKRELIVQERIELEHIQMNSERLTARGPNAREER